MPNLRCGAPECKYLVSLCPIWG